MAMYVIKIQCNYLFLLHVQGLGEYHQQLYWILHMPHLFMLNASSTLYGLWAILQLDTMTIKPIIYQTAGAVFVNMHAENYRMTYPENYRMTYRENYRMTYRENYRITYRENYRHCTMININAHRHVYVLNKQRLDENDLGHILFIS